MSTSPKRLAVLASAALAFAGLTVLAPPAQAASPGLVISEVYGAGGGTGATYNADYVELANPTAGRLSVDGLYIHYRSATGASGGTPFALTGSVPANGHYLIQMSNTGAVGAALPSPDTGPAGFSMAAAGGQVFLLDSSTAIVASGNMAGVAGIVDMVGSNGSTSFETAATTDAATATQSLQRTAADADDNSVEFSLANTAPENTFAGGGDAPVARAIAEVQGDGFVSPDAGLNVTVRGVVTAAYPRSDGDLSGFYMQTEGTGGSVDLSTLDTSDGIFVYQTSGTVSVTPGLFVEVTGMVREKDGETQIGAAADDVDTLPDASMEIGPIVTEWPDDPGERELLEGLWYAPQGNFTITDNFPTNSNGELTLAQGDGPLLTPTEVAEPGTTEFDDQEAENAARTIVLDDASTTLFLLAPNQDETPPYISNTTPFRTGDSGTFSEDVIFSEGASGYRFEPLTQVVGPANTDSPYAVASTRANAPDGMRVEDTGEAQIAVASFNVLNYFTTLGDANDNNDGDPDGAGGCTAFTDRAGDGNTVSGGCNQRGAWDPQDLNRQQTKIVEAINALDADVVGLMEIENSAQLGETANEAVNTLVAALNADAGAGTWAASPSSAQLPTVASNEMDVISNAIIYKPARVLRVGPSLALGDQSTGTNTAADEAFANAREPLGQKFAPAGGGEEVLVVVNHFKSKGSAGPFAGDTDQGDGQGAGNQSRIRQATALRDWIPTIQGTTDDVLLIGDFNSYTMEDPLQVLYDAGYQDFEVLAGHDRYSYSFDGLSGSLDHVLGNAGAVARMTGADVWNVNSVESIAMEYSRWNNHATDFHTNEPYRSSDHDPVVVGLAEGDLDIQILGTNDFHGRIAADPNSSAAGAAVLAGAVKQLRAANPNTVFAAAGDLIGASTFASFIDKDKPTIDALNEAGLEVSSVGNHEFDRGYDDLVNRVMAAYDATTNPQGGAEWQYLGANVKFKAGGADALTPSWTKTMSGVEVGFVGAVTEHLPELVTPGGIADIEVTDIVDAVNEEADQLKAGGADIVVMLVHEGAGGVDCDEMDNDPTSDFGSIITGVNENVDAIVSGHTHLEYSCDFTVPAWAGRPVTKRPVVSSGQYGTALNQIVFTVDPTTHEVLAKSQAVLRLKVANGGPNNYPSDSDTAAIVQAAVNNAAILGAVPLGQIAGPFFKAKFADGTTDNRGGESTLGNLVAEVQRWATEKPESGGAQIAFMNPGGLRGDMLGLGAAGDPYPRTLTYQMAADAQSFANTLVNMRLTGAQIRSVLEEQWQTNPGGPVPSRPFLRLGTSKGFEYTYDPTRPAGSRILNMWLNGTPIAAGTSYSVTVNSFLATGGDNFRTLIQGTQKRDTGKVDLEAMVDYMAEFANTGDGDPPLPVDYAQHAVGVTFPAGAPASYLAGTDHVKFDLSSLVMTAPTDVRDSTVSVKLGGASLGSFPVTMTLSAPANGNSNDEAGTASVDVVLPASTPSGTATLVVEGAATGTSIEVPVPVTGVTAPPPVPASTTVAGSAEAFPYGKAGLLEVVISRANATGQVEVTTEKGDNLGTVTISSGKGTLALAPKSLKPGKHELTLKYLGTSEFAPSTGKATVTVTKPKPKVKIKVDDEIEKSEGGKVKVRVTAPDDVTVKGKVELIVKGTGKSVTGKLVDGKVVLKLPKLSSVGTYTLKAIYLGSSLLDKANKSVKFELVK